nr:CinA family nicotinamide mononucleotide deamidase-related protein [Desulfobacterales bacterium]
MNVSDPSCEIVAIGTELLLGQIVDTNSSFLSGRLNRIGIRTRFCTTVGDSLEDILLIIREAINRVNIVITAGGLGPTEDDLTREAVSKACGLELEFRPELMAAIEEFFESRGIKMPSSNRKQAFVPKGSLVIHNRLGTAPSFIVEKNGIVIISLPGVPKELYHLMDKRIIPYLKERFRLKEKMIKYKVLKICGIGESAVDAQIKDLMQAENPEIGLLAYPGEIKIRITAKGENKGQADRMIANVQREIYNRLGDLIYGEDEDTLEGKVSELLRIHKATLATLESFTGGLLAARINSQACHSLKQSHVITTLPQLSQFLRFDIDSVLKNNSQEISLRAAKRIKEMANTSIGLACWGEIRSAHNDFQVSTSLAISINDQERVFSYQFGGDPESLRARGVIICLERLRKELLRL